METGPCGRLPAGFVGAHVEEAGRYPSFSFERGAWAHDLIWDGNGRAAGAEPETQSGTREVRTDLVIGCDGRGSLVRKRAGLRLELLPEQYDVLWLKAPTPERPREGCSIMIAVAAREHPAICYTSWDGHLQYGLVMPKGGLKELYAEDWVGQAVRSAPLWLAEHIVTHRDEIEGPPGSTCSSAAPRSGPCRGYCSWATPHTR